MAVTSKNKAVVALCIVGVVALVFAFVVIRSLSGREKTADTGVVMMDIPDAVIDEVPDTKTESYRYSDRYADNIGREESDARTQVEDLWESLNKPEEKAPESVNIAGMDLFDAVDAFDMNGKVKDQPKPNEEPEPQPKKTQPAPKRPADSQSQKPAAKPKPKVKVREEPVHVVSPVADSKYAQVEDDWDEWSDGSSVVSSLDDSGAEVADTTPVRCTFTQPETLKNGQRVMLRTLDPLQAGSIVIPKNTRLAAVATVGQGRLYLTVSGYQSNGNFYALNLVAYDTDGSKGLYCPETESVGMSSASRAVQTGGSILGSAMGSTKAKALNSLITAAVGAGTQVAQEELSKVKVSVPSGYSFYLRNETKY